MQHCRAEPDWAYEFPDRTGPDTQICRTGPAGLTYTFKHFTYQESMLKIQTKSKPKNKRFNNFLVDSEISDFFINAIF